MVLDKGIVQVCHKINRAAEYYSQNEWIIKLLLRTDFSIHQMKRQQQIS